MGHGPMNIQHSVWRFLMGQWWANRNVPTKQLHEAAVSCVDSTLKRTGSDRLNERAPSVAEVTVRTPHHIHFIAAISVVRAQSPPSSPSTRLPLFRRLRCRQPTPGQRACAGRVCARCNRIGKQRPLRVRRYAPARRRHPRRRKRHQQRRLRPHRPRLNHLRLQKQLRYRKNQRLRKPPWRRQRKHQRRRRPMSTDSGGGDASHIPP